jgi:purine-cytosine permease-like protein
MGVMISIPIFVVGGQLGLGLSVRDLVLATFLGAAVLGVIGGLTARLGAVTRCSTALIAQVTFGRKGDWAPYSHLIEPACCFITRPRLHLP